MHERTRRRVIAYSREKPNEPDGMTSRVMRDKHRTKPDKPLRD
jgi:hypothetical protein